MYEEIEKHKLILDQLSNEYSSIREVNKQLEMQVCNLQLEL